MEGYHELSSKTQNYFSTAVANWDADFYIKVDDDVHVNLGPNNPSPVCDITTDMNPLMFTVLVQLFSQVS